MSNNTFYPKGKPKESFVSPDYVPEKKIIRGFEHSVNVVPIGTDTFMEVTLKCIITGKTGYMELIVVSEGQHPTATFTKNHEFAIFKTAHIIAGSLFTRVMNDKFKIKAIMPLPSDEYIRSMMQNRK